MCQNAALCCNYKFFQGLYLPTISMNIHCFFILNPLPDDKVSDWPKLKQIADDI